MAGVRTARLIAAFFAAGPVLASAACLDESPANAHAGPIYEMVQPRPLSAQERATAERLLENLQGRFRGQGAEMLCLAGKPPREEVRPFKVRVKARRRRNYIEFEVSMRGSSAQDEKLKLTLTETGELRWGITNRGADVGILELTERRIEFYERWRYRTPRASIPAEHVIRLELDDQDGLSFQRGSYNIEGLTGRLDWYAPSTR